MKKEAGQLPAFDKDQNGAARGSPPVYNCLAILSAPDAEGWIAARCSNLPGLVVRGKSQREALAALVAAFKAEVSRLAATGQAIPWNESPGEPAPGEQQRWVAVHL
jgi:hypothetical protein